MIKKLLLIVIILALFGLNPFVPATAAEQIITGLAVEGNQLITEQEILGVLQTEIGDFHNEERLKADLEAIYQLGFFQDVTVSFEVYNAGFKAIFAVVEYPLLKEIVLTGHNSYPTETLLALLAVKTGKILNHNQLLAGRQAIEQRYQEDGYALAQLRGIDISEEGILSIEINEGYLNEVIIEGNEKTKDFVILKELDLTTGQVLNIKDIQKGYQRLVRLNFFEKIEPRLEKVDQQANLANLILEVSEGKTGNCNGGVAWSSKDGWLGFIDVQERNLMGNGQTLGFNWEFGGVTNYSLSFQEPWLFGSSTSFGISLYDRTSDTTDAEQGEFEEHRRGGSISLGHRLVEDWYGKVRFKIENSSVDWADQAYQDEEASVRSMTLQASRDTTNHPFNPTAGGMDLFSIEYAGQVFGGDADFTKYNLDVRRFYPGFWAGNAWALRAKTGIGEGSLPELEKYRLGGSETLRGYDYGSFSGNNLLLLKVEYRFPIVDNFTGVVFADGGNTWDELEEIELGELHYSLGLGIRMNTPIGMIRLDYGFNEDGGGQPHFSIGQSF